MRKKMKNDSFETIGKVLNDAKSILVFTHQNADGDAVGATVALTRVLRQRGKDCYILFDDDEIAENLRFMDRGYSSDDEEIIRDPDVTICIDAAELKRFPKRKEKFLQGKVKICIDHHMVDETICDYNHIDSGAAAAGELIYKLFQAMEAEIDKETAEALFAAITTDTGNFQYSNTTKESHMIVTDLYDLNMDAAAVSRNIYESVRPEKMRLQSMVKDQLELFADGQLAVAIVRQDQLKACNAVMSDSEGIVGDLRSIKGVEIAVLIKEDSDNKCFVSFRSKTEADVAEIAAQFDGGGHKRAAGCTIYSGAEDVYQMVKQAVLDYLKA